MSEPKHVWISNAAFSRITGIKKVCLSCGAASPGPQAKQPCPGHLPEPSR